MNEKDIIKFHAHIKAAAESEFDMASAEWKENMRFYMDEYSFQNKIDWQTKIKDPIVDNLVVRMSNYFVRILMSTDNKYFTVEHPDKNIQTGLNKLLEQSLIQNRFPLVFGDALKMALLTAPYITKINYTYTEETYPQFNETNGEIEAQKETVGRVNIKPVNPFNVMMDPDGNNYIIETKRCSVAEYQALARVNNWNKTKTILQESVNKSEGDVDYVSDVKLDYVYSKFISDARGQVLDEHIHYVVANDKHVVYYGKNNLPNGQFPYCVGFPMKVLQGRYGRGYITKLRSLLSSYVESMNLLLDAFTISTLGVYEVVTANIESGKAHLFGSVVPGRMYPVSAPNTINQVYNNALNPNAVNLLFTIDRLIQNRSFQNEFFQGAPTSKGRPTASEVATKTQETSSFFTDIASEIERSIIEPSLQTLLHTELMYMDDDFHAPLFTEDETDKAVVTLLGMSFNERMKLVKDARIRVRGVSGKVMKMSNFNKLMQIVNVIGNMPKVANAVDPTKFVRRIFESFDEAPEDLLNMEMIENVNQPEGTVPETPPQGPAMPGMPGGLNGQGPASPQGDEAQQQLEEVLRNVRRNQRQQ